jgi:hypothetical protein
MHQIGAIHWTHAAGGANSSPLWWCLLLSFNNCWQNFLSRNLQSRSCLFLPERCLLPLEPKRGRLYVQRVKLYVFRYWFLYITKTVYYEVSCGVVVGCVQKATVDRGSDPAGAQCELPPKGGWRQRRGGEVNKDGNAARTSTVLVHFVRQS